mmetsp:Transcript_16005/g.34662  ORF Transcript_16005/g.34662 Transcript_16005/m.34662 type:complete len:329 (+) Transcript_16005:231-1217(+)
MVETNKIEMNTMDDAALLQKAHAFYVQERLLKAAELLKQVKDKENHLTDHHKMIIRWAELIESNIDSLLRDSEQDGGPWIKQREQHGDRDFLVSYQVDDNNKLIARIDCAIESSLLVPLLSVFNESELYPSWLPSWNKPFKFGVMRSEKLKVEGRGRQIIHVTSSLMWPFCDRDIIFRVMAVDAIEDDHGCIAIQALTQTSEDDPVIPKATKNAVQMDVANFILIRACPSDHPCVTRSKHNDHEPRILLSMSLEADAHIDVVPKWVQNFFTRTVLGHSWSTTMQVAEEVRDGKRPKHKEAIDAKPEFYAWLDERAGQMIKKLGKEKEI